MKLIDSIYGEFEVEPIFELLISTKEMQRLKRIHQVGASYLVNPKWNVTRYDHSVGTMLLIRILGGSIEEQIAGLLHDISHTAFSHVVDFALKNEHEDYHEKIYEEIIHASKIPRILEDAGLDFKDILFNESKWTILEQSAPKLCADRIDYTLRDLYHYEYINKGEIEQFLNHLEVSDGEIVITSLEEGEWFVKAYYKEVIEFFMNPSNVYANDRLSKAIEIGLNKKVIRTDDLLEDDTYVEKMLREAECKEIQDIMKDLNGKVKLMENKDDYDIHQKQKFRAIDPTIKIDQGLCRVSEKSDLSKQVIEVAAKRAREGVYIKIML